MNRQDVLFWISIAWLATLCGGATWLLFFFPLMHSRRDILRGGFRVQ